MRGGGRGRSRRRQRFRARGARGLVRARSASPTGAFAAIRCAPSVIRGDPAAPWMARPLTAKRQQGAGPHPRSGRGRGRRWPPRAGAGRGCGRQERDLAAVGQHRCTTLRGPSAGRRGRPTARAARRPAAASGARRRRRWCGCAASTPRCPPARGRSATGTGHRTRRGSRTPPRNRANSTTSGETRKTARGAAEVLTAYRPTIPPSHHPGRGSHWFDAARRGRQPAGHVRPRWTRSSQARRRLRTFPVDAPPSFRRIRRSRVFFCPAPPSPSQAHSCPPPRPPVPARRYRRRRVAAHRSGPFRSP